MKYKLIQKSHKEKGIWPKEGFIVYPLASKKHKFKVANTEVKNILIADKNTVYVLVSKKVQSKYNQLLKILTELLVSDDSSGSNIKESLNLIEKFRLEIKTKYRKYLKEKELKEMAMQLKKMQLLAFQKEIEIRSYQTEEYIGKSK